MTAGFLIAGGPAIVRRRGDAVELTDLWYGRQYTADGRFGDAVLRRLAGEPAPELAALPADHPLREAVDRLSGLPTLPLEPAAALELGGFDTLFLELLGRCNERCVHCYAGSAPEIEEALSRETCEQVIDDAAELGFRRLQLTGGDPLLASFLPELVDRARARGIATIEIYTNGLALSDRLLDRLAPHRPAFAFSFYSHDPAHHDAITQTPGSQRRTLAAIDRVVARGLEARASMVVMAENAGDQQATVDLLRAHGVGFVAVTASYGVGRGDLFEGELVRLGSRAHRGGAGDGQARGSLCVTYRGEVVPCIFNRDDVLGRIGERRLVDVARAPELPPKRLMTADQMIASCKRRLSCAGCQLTACALQLAARGEGG
jgi:MoaA/NifB/PqqE/SkfB family radical SAM enzyme